METEIYFLFRHQPCRHNTWRQQDLWDVGCCVLRTKYFHDPWVVLSEAKFLFHSSLNGPKHIGLVCLKIYYLG